MKQTAIQRQLGYRAPWPLSLYRVTCTYHTWLVACQFCVWQRTRASFSRGCLLTWSTITANARTFNELLTPSNNLESPIYKRIVMELKRRNLDIPTFNWCLLHGALTIAIAVEMFQNNVGFSQGTVRPKWPVSRATEQRRQSQDVPMVTNFSREPRNEREWEFRCGVAALVINPGERWPSVLLGRGFPGARNRVLVLSSLRGDGVGVVSWASRRGFWLSAKSQTLALCSSGILASHASGLATYRARLC